MLGHLPGKIKKIVTSLQCWNLYYQNTKNTQCFRKPRKNIPLPKHFENDHEIVLETPGKLATGFIYNTNENETKTFQVYIKKNFKRNYIRHSKYKITQPVIFAENNGELKMCVDYKKINAVTVKNKYPLPLMTNMRTRFRDARYFTILDLLDAFNFVKIK